MSAAAGVSTSRDDPCQSSPAVPTIDYCRTIGDDTNDALHPAPAKRRRANTSVVGQGGGQDHRRATCCCRWLPAAPDSTERSFVVWLSAEQLVARQSAHCGSATDSDLVFCWRITCEKHIPFCVKELSGHGKLGPSSDWRSTVTTDLSRSGYGVVTLSLTVVGADERDAVHVTTVREVCTDLPQGRSMTRAAPAPSSTGGTRPVDSTVPGASAYPTQSLLGR